MRLLLLTTRRGAISGVCLGWLALGLTATAVGAADEISYEIKDEGSGWFVRGAARVLFGVKASVSQVPQTVTSGVYDDGFVLPDISGTASGRTWYWGYQDNAQIVGNELRLSQVTGTPMAGLFNDRAFDPSVGGEIVGGVGLARFSVGRREARLGLEVGFGYNALSLRESSSASGQSTLAVGAYNLGDTVPPLAPYTGTFAGPGPQIDLNPSFSGSISSASQSSFSGELEASLYLMKLGVWFDYPFSRRLTGTLSLGYAALYVDSRLKYQEATTFAKPALADLGPTSKTVGGRDWRPGVYAQLRLDYDFSQRFGAYVGGEIQYNGDFQFEGQGRRVTLSFQPVLAATAGVVFRF